MRATKRLPHRRTTLMRGWGTAPTMHVGTAR